MDAGHAFNGKVTLASDSDASMNDSGAQEDPWDDAIALGRAHPSSDENDGHDV